MKTEDKKWLEEYYEEYSRLIISDETVSNMILAKETILEARKNNKKIIFIGNGASNLIASHGAIDFLNQIGIKTMSVNDPSFLTAASNDFGYEHVFNRFVNLYAEEGDILVAISSSGMSENVIRAVDTAKKKNCLTITFSGFEYKNALKLSGDINFWVKSNMYNQVESIHNNWLVTICDFIIKDEMHNVGIHGIEF
jgi:D-sedoheptulose 7-phosphate isomerase